MTTTQSRMKLANVVRGRLQKPLRILIYGLDGVGKSTFAACAPAPIFIGVEDGTATLDVPRYPEPHSFADVLDALTDLERGDPHDYKTAVIDTLDWLEPMIWARVVGTGKRTASGTLIESIEDFGYQKGYTAALDEWRVMLAQCERLRDRGMHMILIAHSWIKSFKNPEGEDFDRYEMKLNKLAAGLLREWSDIVLFATHEQYTHAKNKHARSKGISTGARVMYTQRRAAFDAKNRHSLPESLPLDWEAFFDAVIAGMPEPLEDTRNRIAMLLAPLADSDPLRDRVAQAVMKAGDNPQQLARIANKLTAQLGTQTNNNDSEGAT